MICEWESKLDYYLDSELPANELQEVRAHLLTCSSCAATALDRLRWKQMTRIAGQRFHASPDFPLKVERSIAPTKNRRWTVHWMPAFAAIASIALISAATIIWLQQSRGEEQVLSELADLHVSTLASANPVDVLSTDRHTVKPWFQGKLPFTFNLPELKNTPYNLIGGRVAYFEQSPGAQLLFGLGKHRISVFIFQDRGEAGRLNSLRSPSGKLTFTSETWTEGSLRYILLSDAASSDLHTLRDLLIKSARSADAR